MGQGLLTSSRPAPDPEALFRDAGLERGPDGLLRLGGVSLEALASDAGTPAYVYNAAVIRARYAELESAFASVPHRIHYAVKANSNLAILGLMESMGAGADIVSGGELERAIRAGIPTDRIVMSGVGKTQEELERALATGVRVNLESADELTLLERIAAQRPLGAHTRLGIRVNPDIPADTHPFITTGMQGNKFGVGSEQAIDLAARIAGNPRLELETLAMHLGSQILAPDVYADGVRRLLDLRATLVSRGIRSVRALDLGGGFGIRYQDEVPLDPASLAARVIPLLAASGLELHLEPGRFLTGSAGILLCRVLYRKQSGPKAFVVVDAAMNDLLRPSHYDAHHAVVEVRVRGRPARPVDVVGPVCESGDFLALDRVLPDVPPGDLLAILCTGAYGFVMASNYNSRPRPPELLVDRGRYAIVRRRETVDQLLAGEVLRPFPARAP